MGNIYQRNKIYWMTKWKHFLNTEKKLCIQTHTGCGSIYAYYEMQKNSGVERGIEYEIPPLEEVVLENHRC